jgi:hypothetical protein
LAGARLKAQSGEVEAGSPQDCATNAKAQSGEVETGSPQDCETDIRSLRATDKSLFRPNPNLIPGAHAGTGHSCVGCKSGALLVPNIFPPQETENP